MINIWHLNIEIILIIIFIADYLVQIDKKSKDLLMEQIRLKSNNNHFHFGLSPEFTLGAL